MTRTLFLLFAIFCTIPACKNDNSKPNNNVSTINKIDTVQIVVSDFSKGSYFLVLKINNKQTKVQAKIVIENIALFTTTRYKSDSEYIKEVANAIKNDKPLDVDTDVYSQLDNYCVSTIDSSVTNSSSKGENYFINKFFKENKDNRLFFQCFKDDDLEKQLIFVLITKWKCLVARDDETGCIILPKWTK